jgi:PTH1 family peptidyl-tRNA hydrolase
MESLHIIAGLGNPGREYANTRHNVGFLVLERLAKRWQIDWRHEAKFQARLARASRGGRTAWLCEPQTYMNLSGEAVGALAHYYQAAPAQVAVVMDDADLPLGELRMRPKGGTGGHHGLESVQQHLGTPDYPRLRIGISRGAREAGPRELTGHVLGPFDRGEAKLLEQVLDRAADQLECWLAEGIEKAMNQFNGSVIEDPK